MAKIEDLRVLTDADPIQYDSKQIVYFFFDKDDEPEILTTRYVAEKKSIIAWLEKAVMSKCVRVVAVWPGMYRSEAFLCDPVVALKQLRV